MLKKIERIVSAMLAVMLFLGNMGANVYAETTKTKVSVSGIPAGLNLGVCKILYVQVDQWNRQQITTTPIQLTNGEQEIDLSADPVIPSHITSFKSKDGPYIAFNVNGQLVRSGFGFEYNNEVFILNIDDTNPGNIGISLSQNAPLEKGKDVTYQDALGDAKYYGVVVDTFLKTGHSDTNIAAKVVDGSGNITLGAYTNDNNPGSCVIGETTMSDFAIDTSGTVDAIVYLSDEVTLKSGSQTTEVTRSKDAINNYIDSLMDYVYDMSDEMAEEDTYVYVKPSTLDQNNLVLDLTDKPAGTYYIKGESIFNGEYKWSNQGFKLNSDQTIVFNFTSTSVNLTEFKTTIGGKTVGSPQSDEDAFGPASHLIFNMPNATTVNFSAGVQGVFIAPNALCQGSTSSGWLIADSFKSESEWHMVWQYMPDNDHLPVVEELTPEGTAELSVTKEVIGNDYTGDGTFSFTLSDANDEGKDGYKMPTEDLTQTVEKDGTGTFGEITFDKEGDYYFKINEDSGSIPGMGYDISDKFAKVKVTASGSSLATEVTYGTSKTSCNDSSLTVKNKYSMTSYTPSVVKVVEGTDVPTETYKFTLTDKSTDKSGETGVTTSASVTGAGTASFGEITYTKEGTYVYEIKETDGGTPGMTYSSNPVTITVEVKKDSATGELTTDVKVTGGDTTAKEIKNTYEKPTCSVKLKVKKEVTGNTYDGNENFSFKLTDINADKNNGYSMPSSGTTKTAKNGSEATFNDITFDKTGTYYFQIAETAESTDGMSYDTAPKFAKVDVALSGDKKSLIPTVKYGTSKESCNDGSLTVKNKYSKTTYTPKVVKVVSGTGAPSETYNFTLTDKSADKTGESGVTKSASVTGAGTAEFGEITYTKAGTYVYEIAETEGSTLGMTYSSKPVTITVTVSKTESTGALTASVTSVSGGDTDAHAIKNTYEKPGGSATLSVEKEVTGNTYSGDEDFSFTLSDENDDNTGYTMPESGLTKTVKDGGVVTFDAITFDEVGKYYFGITETAGDTTGMEYDTAKKYAIVNVTRSGDGKSLITDVKYGDSTTGSATSLTVKNKYSKTTYTPRVVKVVEGTDVPTETYKFTLTDKSTDKSGETGVTTSASVTGAGTASFGEITYTKEGTYVYEIKETDGGTPGMTYSSNPVTITVDVEKDSATGELTTDVKVTGGDTGEHEIKNEYVKPEGSVTLSVKKEITGDSFSGTDTFSFTLSDVNSEGTEGYTMPADKTVSIQKGQTGTFGAIQFDEVGTYYFKIKEADGAIPGMSYDTEDKFAKVVVTVDGDDLKADVKYGATMEGASDSGLTVTNTYDRPDSTVRMQVKKAVSDSSAPDETFTFELTEPDTQNTLTTDPLTATAKDQETAIFDGITYVDEGSFTYYITEKTPTNKTTGMSYSEKKITATVTAEMVDSELVTTVSYSGGDGTDKNTITNTYVPVTIKINLMDYKGTSELANGKLVLKDNDGNEVDTWDSKTGETWEVDVNKLEVGKEYTITEPEAPEGYEKIATDIKFEINSEFDIKVNSGTEGEYEVKENVLIVKDPMIPYEVQISKQDITGDEIDGALLEIYEGTTITGVDPIRSWRSEEGKIHKVSLGTGTYTLVEKTAPNGYLKAESITFFVTTDGTVQVKDSDGVFVDVTDKKTIEMVDAYDDQTVKISKQDIYGNEIDDAELEIYAGTTTTGVTPLYNWESEAGKTHSVALQPGTYTLVEKTTPNGYVQAESIVFSVDKDGVVKVRDLDGTFKPVADAKVVMVDAYEDQTVKISKQDIAGNEIDGAELEIYNGTTTVGVRPEKSWKSEADKTHSVRLQPGTYTLVEKTAPDGYVVAESIVFSVDKDGIVKVKDTDGNFKPLADAKVVMVDDTTKVTISKQDITGEEIPGAHLEVSDKNGETVDEWISEKGVSHQINGVLAAGETYTLTETLAPYGYALANSIDFTVNEDGTVQHVVMIDEYADHFVNIKKTDIAGQELKGAELRVVSQSGKLIDQWISTGIAHVIRVKPGTYTLYEDRAPLGYDVAASITFEVDFDGRISIANVGVKQIVMIDAELDPDKKVIDDETTGPGSDTGDNSNPLLYTTMFATSILAAAFVFLKKRKESAD